MLTQDIELPVPEICCDAEVHFRVDQVEFLRGWEITYNAGAAGLSGSSGTAH